jgi:hypothetical protein
MEDNARNDVRKLLKTFGIQADQAIMAQLEKISNDQSLRVRIILEDQTDYADSSWADPLHLEIEGEIRR